MTSPLRNETVFSLCNVVGMCFADWRRIQRVLFHFQSLLLSVPPCIPPRLSLSSPPRRPPPPTHPNILLALPYRRSSSWEFPGGTAGTYLSWWICVHVCECEHSTSRYTVPVFRTLLRAWSDDTHTFHNVLLLHTTCMFIHGTLEQMQPQKHARILWYAYMYTCSTHVPLSHISATFSPRPSPQRTISRLRFRDWDLEIEMLAYDPCMYTSFEIQMHALYMWQIERQTWMQACIQARFSTLNPYKHASRLVTCIKRTY